MDVIGRDQGPHIDGWELEQAKQQMHGVDLSRCSVQEHKGFSTVIPTLSFVVSSGYLEITFCFWVLYNS